MHETGSSSSLWEDRSTSIFTTDVESSGLRQGYPNRVRDRERLYFRRGESHDESRHQRVPDRQYAEFRAISSGSPYLTNTISLVDDDALLTSEVIPR